MDFSAPRVHIKGIFYFGENREGTLPFPSFQLAPKISKRYMKSSSFYAQNSVMKSFLDSHIPTSKIFTFMNTFESFAFPGLLKWKKQLFQTENLSYMFAFSKECNSYCIEIVK